MNPQSCDDDCVSSESEDESMPMSKTLAMQSEGKSILEKELAFQLRKRTLIIEQLRKAYLRDVVAMKYIVNEVLVEEERRRVFDDWKDTVPSADLKDCLQLRSPYFGALTIAPCKKCGGTIEIVFSDIQKVKDLQGRVDTLVGRNELLRLMIATQEAQSEKLIADSVAENQSHSEEKKYLYSEIRRLKEEMEETAISARKISEANRRVREENMKHISNNNDITIRALENAKALERALESNANYKDQIGELRQEIYGYQTGSQHLETRIRSLEKKVLEKDSEIAKKVEVIEEMDNDISELKIQMDKQREFSKTAENAADLAERAKESLAEENRKLQVVIEKQLRVNEGLEDRVDALQEELRGVTAQLETSLESSTTARYERDLERAKVAGLEANLAFKTAEVEQGKAMYEALQSVSTQELSKLQTLIDSLEVEKEEAEVEIARLRDAVAEGEELISKLENSLESSTSSSVAHAADSAMQHQQAATSSEPIVAQSYSPTRRAEKSVARVRAPDAEAAAPVASKAEKEAEVVARVSTPPEPIKKYTPAVKKTARVNESSPVRRKSIEFVALLPLVNPDSVDESFMREKLLRNLNDSFDEITSRKIVNCLAPLIGERSNILESTLQAATDAIVAQREAQKTNDDLRLFLDGAIGISNAETLANAEDVSNVLKKVLWSVQRKLPAINEQDVDGDAGITEPAFPKVMYQDLLGSYNSVESDGIRNLQNIIKDVQSQVLSNSKHFSDGITVVANEWATAKTIALYLDDTIAAAKESVREELGPQITDNTQAIKKLTSKLETEIAGRKLLIQKYTESVNEVTMLRPRSERLFHAEERAKILQKAHDEMEIALRDLILKHSQLEVNFKELEEKLAETSDRLVHTNFDLEKQHRDARSMRGSIQSQEGQIVTLNLLLQKQLEAERHRVEALSTSSTQCEPIVADIAIQTEFIIPAMSLAINKQRHRYRPRSSEGQIISPSSMLSASLTEHFLFDKKSSEFEKGLDALRLGPNSGLPSPSSTLSSFAVSLLEGGGSPLLSPPRVSLSRNLPKLHKPSASP